MNSPTYQAMVTVTIPVEVTAEQAARLDRCRNKIYDWHAEGMDPYAPLVPIVDINMVKWRAIGEIAIGVSEARHGINQESTCIASEKIANDVARQIQRAVTDAVRTSIKMELQK